MGESKVQKKFKTSTFACTQYYMLMTTLSLRNSILSLMLIGGMAVSVNSFAQGRRGGFGGTRQSPSVQQSRTTATERHSTAPQSRSSYGRSSATQSRSSERSTVAPSRTPQVPHQHLGLTPPPFLQLFITKKVGTGVPFPLFGEVCYFLGVISKSG